MQYAHTLIAIPKDFVPSGIQVQTFFQAIMAHGVVPEETSTVIRMPSGLKREYRNPLSGEMHVVEFKSGRSIEHLGDLAEAVTGLHEYEVEVAGSGHPKTPPLPIDFSGDYYVGVTCFVFAELRSTCDLHDESPASQRAVAYGKRCASAIDVGQFSNPEDLTIIRVPGAGCARFWIQIQLGKFLLPRLESGRLDILHPTVVAAARNHFGVPFVQGCVWG